jgi:hypothetical protein
LAWVGQIESGLKNFADQSYKLSGINQLSDLPCGESGQNIEDKGVDCKIFQRKNLGGWSWGMAGYSMRSFAKSCLCYS